MPSAASPEPASSSRPLQVGLVGLGRMGSMILEALNRGVPAIAVPIVVDPRPDTDRRAREITGNDHLVRVGIAELGPLVSDLDAVIISTPTPQHGDQAAWAIANDLHVFCEKPVTFDGASSRQLQQAADGRGVVLQSGFFRRFAAPWVTARQLLKSGAIGVPAAIHCVTWDQDTPDPGFADPAVSGGLLVDDGVHEFDVASWLTGAPFTVVSAVEGPDHNGVLTRVGDAACAFVTGRLADETVVTVSLARNARFADDMRCEILGSEGAIFVESSPVGATRIGTGDGMRSIDAGACPDGFDNGLIGELRAFADVINGAAVDYPNGADSATAVDVANAAVTSARQGGAWVPIAP